MSSDAGTGIGADRRIPMIDPERLSESQQVVYDKIVSGARGVIVGPLRVALHSPELADRWQSLGEFLRFNTTLPKVVSELAIIVTGRYWNSQVEWSIHAGIALDCGVPDEVVEAIRRAEAPVFDDPAHALVYEFTRSLLEFGQVDDDVYQALYDLTDEHFLVELTALVGYYSLVAMTLNVHRVPLPENLPARGLDLPETGALMHPARLPACKPAQSSDKEN